MVQKGPKGAWWSSAIKAIWGLVQCVCMFGADTAGCGAATHFFAGGQNVEILEPVFLNNCLWLFFNE